MGNQNALCHDFFRLSKSAKPYKIGIFQLFQQEETKKILTVSQFHTYTFYHAKLKIYNLHRFILPFCHILCNVQGICSIFIAFMSEKPSKYLLFNYLVGRHLLFSMLIWLLFPARYMPIFFFGILVGSQPLLSFRFSFSLSGRIHA